MRHLAVHIVAYSSSTFVGYRYNHVVVVGTAVAWPLPSTTKHTTPPAHDNQVGHHDAFMVAQLGNSR